MSTRHYCDICEQEKQSRELRAVSLILKADNHRLVEKDICEPCLVELCRTLKVDNVKIPPVKTVRMIDG